jgi:hypothetical protein
MTFSDRTVCEKLFGMDVEELSLHLQKWQRKIIENLGQDFRVMGLHLDPVPAKHEAGILSTCAWCSMTTVYIRGAKFF